VRPWLLLVIPASLTLPAAAQDDEQIARILADSAVACEAGEDFNGQPNATVCFAAGAAILQGLYGMEQDVNRARGMLARACDGDMAEGCILLADILEAQQGPEWRGALMKACELNAEYGCAQVAFGHMTGQAGFKIDGDRAIAAADKSCGAGDPRGCSLATVMYADGGIIPQNLTRSIDAARRGCDLFFEQEDPDGELLCRATMTVSNGKMRRTYKKKAKKLKKLKKKQERGK